MSVATDPDFFDRHPNYRELSGYGATRRDELSVSIGYVDDDIDAELRFVVTCRDGCPHAAELRRLAGAGAARREVPLQAKTLSAACEEADARWPMATEEVARLEAIQALTRKLRDNHEERDRHQRYMATLERDINELTEQLQALRAIEPPEQR